MTILQLLIPVSIVVAGAFLFAFIRAVRGGQYDDVETPAMRMLLDDPKPLSNPSETTKKNQ